MTMRAPTDDTRVQILAEHYRDTFTILQSYLRSRDRFFLLVIVVATVMLFQVFSPDEASIATGQFIAAKVGIEQPLNVSFLGSVTWVIFLWLTVRYFQTVVLIERQYDYFHHLETVLSSYYDGKVFTRESKTYLQNYPKFSDWTWALYTIMFPLLLIGVVVLKAVNEWQNLADPRWLLCVNAVIAAGVFISVFLYLLQVHFRR